MEMYVVQEKKENCGDSVFYKGQIAYAVMPNGRKIALQACGDVKFILPNPDRKFDVYGHNPASGGLEKIEIGYEEQGQEKSQSQEKRRICRSIFNCSQ